ncbi:MAG: type II toxin-antitoxin system PemK/MazF family toxin [Treponema sp.]|nr:type II toxin-antitoxin system PemK/MazF family toxin [Treponema sp.]
MGKFIRGDVVIIPFPFSDLSDNKKRPALVVADLPGDDIIVCQITSQASSDSFSMPLRAGDFSSGSLPVDSFIRPNKIFTADKNIILSTAGHLREDKIRDTLNAIITIIKEDNNEH